jgi:hypothetical protein
VKEKIDKLEYNEGFGPNESKLEREIIKKIQKL